MMSRNVIHGDGMPKKTTYKTKSSKSGHFHETEWMEGVHEYVTAKKLSTTGAITPLMP